MEPATRLIFEQLGIALLLGLLVGLQRQRSAALLAIDRGGVLGKPRI